ncbi:MAG: winged helix-turn-helix domain-containing protein, partial [Candidatus Acidiferrum sp.]
MDLEQRVLLKQGKPVPLPPKDIETLLILVEGHGQIVEKQQLMERIWPGTFVEEGNLTRHVFNLRQILADG